LGSQPLGAVNTCITSPFLSTCVVQSVLLNGVPITPPSWMNCPAVSGGSNIIFYAMTTACEAPGYYTVRLQVVSSNCPNVDDFTFPSGGFIVYLDITRLSLTTPAFTTSFTFPATPYVYVAGVDTVMNIPFPVITISPACPNAIFAVESSPGLPTCATWSEFGGLTLTNCGYSTIYTSRTVTLKKAGFEIFFYLDIQCPTYTSIVPPSLPLEITFTIGNSYNIRYINGFGLTPACGYPSSFSLSPQPGSPAILSFWSLSSNYLYLATTSYANLGTWPFTLTAYVSNNPSLSATVTVNAKVYCMITAYNLSGSTITSPVHFLGNSPPKVWPSDTTIPLPTLSTKTPNQCPAVLAPKIQLVSTLLTPAWITNNVITSHDSTLHGTYAMQVTFGLSTTGYVLNGAGSPIISFTQELVDCTLVSITQSAVVWDSLYVIDGTQAIKATPLFSV
jgi:hypothetical protein